jgi:DNA mismatch repair ATPase MutS
MGHPLLSERQIRNPIDLSKNLVITGPNAAGKTTYMKAVCINLLFSQTMGIVCARKAFIQPVHAISSFVRIHDDVGKESLFEAEVKRCAQIIQQASRGLKAVYFLDEPMHSTPPIEGAATAMSVIKYLGKMNHVRVLATTHYHQLTKLETELPTIFKNISMEALDTKKGFMFPYRLCSGPSFQCIALEILKERDIPDEVVRTAIEIKNKICNAVIDQRNDS